MEEHYDRAFDLWYSQHYDLKRMVTLPIDGGCQWGRSPRRRCKHCSIQGLTPKVAPVASVVQSFETLVGELESNVYAAGDSTLGFSTAQWGGEFSFLDELAEGCEKSSILRGRRFMLAYGLVAEFLKSAHVCKGFVRTWNVGIEAFDATLLRGDSKGINRNAALIHEALELAKSLDYRLYASGILGLPGTTLADLRKEVDNWLALAEAYSDIITTISVAPPAVIPGSRMYWDVYVQFPAIRALHGELLPCRRLTEFYVRQFTDVTLEDIEAATAEVARGTLLMGKGKARAMKFGGYMMGGVDSEERKEHEILRNVFSEL